MTKATNKWSTSTVANEKSIDYWNELLTENVIGLDIETDARDDFGGRIVGTTLAHQNAFMISARDNQRACHRIQTKSATSADEIYILIHMRCGEFHLKTSTVDAHLKVGDAVLLSATEAFRFVCPENTSSLVLRFEQPWLKKWIPLADDCVGVHIDGGNGWGQTLSSALWNIEPGEIANWTNPPADVADQVAGLLGLALQPNQLSSTASSLLKRISASLRNRFEEPDLSPAHIAAEIGISKRYLHQLISKTGTTFNQLLFKIRLERARKLLVNKSYDHLTVTEIATTCGFKDAGHFTRLFKNEFRTPPSKFRNRR